MLTKSTRSYLYFLVVQVILIACLCLDASNGRPSELVSTSNFEISQHRSLTQCFAIRNFQFYFAHFRFQTGLSSSSSSGSGGVQFPAAAPRLTNRVHEKDDDGNEISPSSSHAVAKRSLGGGDFKSLVHGLEAQVRVHACKNTITDALRRADAFLAKICTDFAIMSAKSSRAVTHS